MIRWSSDVGAPAVVAAVDVLTSEKKPTWNKPVGIGLSALGYVLGGVMGIGGAFTKNLGIAAAPWAMESIYEYIRGTTVTSQRLSLQPASRISRYPAPPSAKELEGVRLD